MSKERLLELENRALRIHVKQLNTMLDASLCALREANSIVADEYMRRRKAEKTLAGLRHANLQCAALGVQPMYSEN